MFGIISQEQLVKGMFYYERLGVGAGMGLKVNMVMFWEKNRGLTGIL